MLNAVQVDQSDHTQTCQTGPGLSAQSEILSWIGLGPGGLKERGASPPAEESPYSSCNVKHEGHMTVMQRISSL